ncbi:MAG: universal stress protein [Bacteroidota bacterium]
MIFTSFSQATRATFARLRESERSAHLRHVLIPVDFSDCSENAIRYGLAIALQAGAKITLLHGISVPLQNADFIASPLEQMERDAQEKLEATAREVAGWLNREALPELEIRTQIKVGFIGDLILDLIGEESVDLVVMGTNGAGRIEGFILGSNTTHIIEKAPCPVLAVPEEAQFEGIDKIVFATDLGKLVPETVQSLIEVARLFAAGIDVLNIFTPNSHYSPSKAEEFKVALLREVDYDRLSFHIFETGLDDITEALQVYLDKNGADLVVMQTHHRGFLARLFKPSRTRRMALHTRTPLLALHHPQRN